MNPGQSLMSAKTSKTSFGNVGDEVDEVSVQRLKVLDDLRLEATGAADPIGEYPMQQSKEFDGVNATVLEGLLQKDSEVLYRVEAVDEVSMQR